MDPRDDMLARRGRSHRRRRSPPPDEATHPHEHGAEARGPASATNTAPVVASVADQHLDVRERSRSNEKRRADSRARASTVDETDSNGGGRDVMYAHSRYKRNAAIHDAGSGGPSPRRPPSADPDSGRRSRRSHASSAGEWGHGHGDTASAANYAQPSQEYMKAVRRKAAERLSFRWRFLGTFGLCCLVGAALTLGLLAHIEGGFGVDPGSGHSNERQYGTPQWFSTHMPAILSNYATTHNNIVKSMYSKNSKFLIHEIPVNATSVHESFLGLVSSFMLAIVTDRALLVQWTEDWLTPLPSTDLMQSTGYTYNASAESRRVKLEDVFNKPGFEWDYDAFMDRYTKGSRDDEPSLYAWDPLDRLNDLTCKNLGELLKVHKFVKITNQNYFMPLIQMNPHYSDMLESELTLSQSFADLFNFLLRPSATVLESIERFKARYMDGNRVIGMEMSVEKSDGDWTGDDAMPDAQQNLFFSHAAQLIKETDDQVAPGSTEGVVFMFVTDNHGQLQNKFEELESSDNNAITAGVVAILAPSGHGVSRVQLEIQELWLLGYAEYIMTTPGSRIGILGAARTHKAPLVVIDETTVHQSTAPYPCLANYRAVEQTTCFVPSMLLKVPADNAVPCG